LINAFPALSPQSAGNAILQLDAVPLPLNDLVAIFGISFGPLTLCTDLQSVVCSQLFLKKILLDFSDQTS
jgi:hypothetical protein